LAKELRDEESGIGLGAVDCNEEPNQALCSKQGVRGYPHMLAMVMGKPKLYHGAREFKPMKAWILGVHESKGTKGGSRKCPGGTFKSKVRDAVVPLCEEHFPQDNAKNAWIIIFYEQNSPRSDFRDAANEAATVLGSEPPDKGKALKHEPMKRRDRLIELEQKEIDRSMEKDTASSCSGMSWRWSFPRRVSLAARLLRKSALCAATARTRSGDSAPTL
jgi:hypothetical protein